MDLTKSFTLAHSLDESWTMLSDVSFVASAIPGCRLLRSDGDVFEGDVKIRIGPVLTQFEGVAEVLERNPDARRLHVEARARDARGQGDARLSIVAELTGGDPRRMSRSIVSCP